MLRGLLIATAAALVPAIAGCEAGFSAPTQRWHQPTPGATALVNNTIRVSNMFVLGPVPGGSLPARGSAGVFLALANTGSGDTLTSISAPGTAASVQLPGGGISLGRQQTVLLTGPAPEVVMRNLRRPLLGGQFVRMVLNFQNAGVKAIAVPVMPRAQYYSTFSPAPPPSPSPSPAPTSKRQQATPTPSPSSTG